MSPTKKENAERTSFFLRNLLKGVIWLAVIVGGYFYLQNHYTFSLEDVLGPVYDKPFVVYSIFLTSEIIFGIIPPELFMIWSLRNEVLSDYIANVAALSAISYVSGMLGYYIGSHFSTTKLYATIKNNYLGKFEKHFARFGGFLVIVAALTPIPFSGICMLMGAVKYPYRKFLVIATSRFLRFAVYAFIIWETNILQ
jgi:membrane protein YqaA with SNARE-associated domain